MKDFLITFIVNDRAVTRLLSDVVKNRSNSPYTESIGVPSDFVFPFFQESNDGAVIYLLKHYAGHYEATLEGSVYISNDNEYYNEALGIQCIVPPSWIVMDLNDAFFEETPQMISYEFVAMESNMDAGNMNLIEVYRMELPEEVLMLMKYLDMTELMSLMKDSIGNGLGLAMEPSQIEVVGNLEFPLEDYGCIRFEGDVDEMDFNGAAVFSIIDSYMYGFVVGNANMYGNAENHPEELFQYFSAISGEYSS